MKTPKEIKIKQSKAHLSLGLGTDVEETLMTVSDKIDEYIMRLGCTNAYTLGILVQLLTVGKVRVDFREYNERLQLAERSDLMNRAEAVQMLDSYIAALGKKDAEDAPAEYEMTQKIIVQPPKPRT